MSEFHTEVKTVKTRKDHTCCCYERYIDSGYGIVDIPYEYRSAIDRMRDQKGIIPSGTECFSWSGKFDGEMYTAHADKEMFDLIHEMGWVDN